VAATEEDSKQVKAFKFALSDLDIAGLRKVVKFGQKLIHDRRAGRAKPEEVVNKYPIPPEESGDRSRVRESFPRYAVINIPIGGISREEFIRQYVSQRVTDRFLGEPMENHLLRCYADRKRWTEDAGALFDRVYMQATSHSADFRIGCWVRHRRLTEAHGLMVVTNSASDLYVRVRDRNGRILSFSPDDLVRVDPTEAERLGWDHSYAKSMKADPVPAAGIVVGSVVRLRSGGPEMTITEHDKVNGLMSCSRTGFGAEVIVKTFPVAALEFVR